MVKETYQVKKWAGRFGDEFTDRNYYGSDETDESYRKDIGISRRELNQYFLGELNRDISILEVGSSIGTQLNTLQDMGFKNLYGIEVNSYALALSKRKNKDVNIIKGSALDIPFKDGYFDLVFTSGVLIHIHPKDIKKAMGEIYRCSSKYIWGFEYFSPKFTEILYRGEKNMHWKANYVKLYLDSFDNLKVVKEKRYKHLDNDNIDAMFLLKKKKNEK